MALYSVNWTATLEGVSGNVSVGTVLVEGGSSFVVASSENRATYGRADGVAITAGDTRNPVMLLRCGVLSADDSGLGDGAASPVRVSSTGTLERVATPDENDDVVGYCETDGKVHLIFGVLTHRNFVDSGGGGTVPTGTGFRHVTAGTEDAASKLVTNADVDAAAAIAGSKVAPDFGAQNVVTTGYVQPASLQFSSSNIATAGLIRLPSTAQYVLTVRDVANTGNLTGIYVDGANGLNFGSDTTWGAAQTFTTVRFGATTAFQLVLNGATFFYLTSSGPAAYQNVNFGLYGGGASFPATGGGVGVFAVGNAGTNPSTTPTGGGVLYATGGALHWRGSSGTDTPIANAEPHCPRCGTDVGVSGATNDLFGEELIHCHACELRTGNGVVVHVADFFERRKSA